MDVFTTMVSQTRMAFGVAIDAKALFKNLQNKNKEFSNKTSQAKEAINKAKAEADGLKNKLRSP